MICDAFDIVAVPFPFVERSAVKRRPALILSSATFNRENKHSIFAMITTAALERGPDDYPLRRPLDAGLVADCVVRMKIFTLPNDMIVKTIGRPADEDRLSLTALMKRILPV